jgi:hypothetical protein
VAAEPAEQFVHSGTESTFTIGGFYWFAGDRIAAAKIYRGLGRAPGLTGPERRDLAGGWPELRGCEEPAGASVRP